MTPEDDTGEGRASLRLSLGWTPAGTPWVGWLCTRGPPNVCGDSRRVDPGGLSVCFAVTRTSVEKEGAWVPEERLLLLAGGDWFPLGEGLYLLSSGEKSVGWATL